MPQPVQISLENAFRQRILILDGAMGTMIQQYKLVEADFRGARFDDFSATSDSGNAIMLKGNNEMLNLTRPDVISAIHHEYLSAGADIIETNTFGANSVSQADYQMESVVTEMNLAAAQIAKAAARDHSTADKPRFVAGALGPTPRTASISPRVDDPGFRNIHFDQLVEAYYEQVKALVEGGVDILLVETVFDTLNCKAAVFAIADYFATQQSEPLPVMISGTVTDASGRILSGQTVSAFWYSIKHIKPIAIGLNCALGAALMRPFVRELANTVSDTAICIYPNAGLPNPMSDTGFDEKPADTAGLLGEFAAAGWLNIAGGCCGTTPAHIKAIAQTVATHPPRILAQK